MTLVSGDITVGKMTFGRLGPKPYQMLHKNVKKKDFCFNDLFLPTKYAKGKPI